MHSLTLCFRRTDLEAKYRAYQFEVAKCNLNGRWGVLSLTSMVTFVIKTIGNAVQLMKLSTPGSLERIAIFLPMTAFCLHHQLAVHRVFGTLDETKSASRAFVVRFVLLSALTEMLVIYVNDTFAAYEGCQACRFRCPYTFSAPKFCARATVLSAIVIFNMTPCTSFLGVTGLAFILCGAGRALGFAWHRDHMMLSLSATACMFYQTCLFLWCRYMQERRDRKRFLLQVHISELRSSL